MENSHSVVCVTEISSGYIVGGLQNEAQIGRFRIKRHYTRSQLVTIKADTEQQEPRSLTHTHTVTHARTRSLMIIYM